MVQIFFALQIKVIYSNCKLYALNTHAPVVAY